MIFDALLSRFQGYSKDFTWTGQIIITKGDKLKALSSPAMERYYQVHLKNSSCCRSSPIFLPYSHKI